MVPYGILLPEWLLRTDAFMVLSAFVAINTLVYVTLAVSKMLPKLYLSDWVGGRDRRAETRSIHPDDPV